MAANAGVCVGSKRAPARLPAEDEGMCYCLVGLESPFLRLAYGGCIVLEQQSPNVQNGPTFVRKTEGGGRLARAGVKFLDVRETCRTRRGSYVGCDLSKKAV